MCKFKKILNKKVNRLFLIVWPPFGEKEALDIDISIGIVFQDNLNKVCVISTDNDDRWTPTIQFKDIPNTIISWTSFKERIKSWMNSEEVGDFDFEYYEITNVNLFGSIVNKKILNLEYLKIHNIEQPFGIKLIFENDYILSTPTSDGNTIETNRFNKNNNILNFKKIGNLKSELIR
jgi:hypothetical protein